MQTTVGQLLVNRVLPESMRDYKRTLDKKTISKLLQQVAKERPEDYREISHALSQIGHQAAYTTGGNSFGLKHLLKAKSARTIQDKIRAKVTQIINDDSLTDDERDEKIAIAVGKHSKELQDAVYKESLEEQNPFARQVASGSRGNPMNLSSLRGSDLLYADHRGKVLPIPVLSSYSEGLTPTEYWAGTYGARSGVVDTKFATAKSGFLSKQLTQIAHRALVTALDDEKEPATLRGLPVDTDDPDSEGSLLAHDVGGFKRNTVLTPKILSKLQEDGVKRILVRSPAVGGPSDGGVYARDAGVREFGGLPSAGSNIGMAAAQSLSEPLSQAQLSSKHGGGVAGADSAKAVGGFDYINQIVQIPKTFKGGAAHAETDGLVQRVEEAPAGGLNILIENKPHYVARGFEAKVKRGDKVEAGDVISDGFPNPSTIVKHKGVGEGRRYFISAFRDAFKNANIKANRRNIELIAKGLVNHVRLTEEMDGYVPDDVVPYSQIEANWKPRKNYRTVAPKQAVGKYLERPYLHYSIGDKVRPSMLKNFEEFGVKEVDVHDDEPPFHPEMVRGMYNLQHDPDWMTRMLGSGQKKSLLSAVHRGSSSDATGTSFVPGLAQGTDFNRIGKVQTPDKHTFKLSFEKDAADPVLRQPLTPEAARQLQLQVFAANRRLNAMRLQEQREEQLGGRGSALARRGDQYNDAWSWHPYSGRVLGPAWIAQFAADQATKPRAGEYGKLKTDPGFHLTPRRMFDWLKSPLREADVESYTYDHPEYGGVPEAVTGDAYMIPGQGRWIDQYNSYIQRGENPPPHVALNAQQELAAVAENNGYNWAEPLWADPQNAEMMRSQLRHDEHMKLRSEAAQKVWQDTMQHVAAAKPGFFDGLHDTTSGRNAASLTDIKTRRFLGAASDLKNRFATGQITGSQYEAELHHLLQNNGLPPMQGYTGATDLENKFGEQLQTFEQQLAREEEYARATPEQRAEMDRQQSRQEQISQVDPQLAEQRRQQVDAMWQETLGDITNRTGMQKYDPAEKAYLNEIKDRFVAGEIGEEQLNQLMPQYAKQMELRMLKVRAADLKDAVDAGRITQDQYNQSIAKANQYAENLIPGSRVDDLAAPAQDTQLAGPPSLPQQQAPPQPQQPQPTQQPAPQQPQQPNRYANIPRIKMPERPKTILEKDMEPLAPVVGSLARRQQRGRNNAQMLQQSLRGPTNSGLIGMTTSPNETFTMNSGNLNMPRQTPKLKTPKQPVVSSGKPIKVPGMKSTTTTPV
jgi:uncharacterized membrane protein